MQKQRSANTRDLGVSAPLRDSVPQPKFWTAARTAPLTWALAVLAAAAGISPSLQGQLEMDSAAVAAGETWRLLTGHFVHWDGAHLFWDLSVFLVLGMFCERRGRLAFLACIVATAAAISLQMIYTLPEIPVYRGLSGIDTGLFAQLAAILWIDARQSGDRPLSWLVAAAILSLIAKISYECVSQATVFVDATAAAFTPLPMVHVLGAVVGGGFGLTQISTSSRTWPWTSVSRTSRPL